MFQHKVISFSWGAPEEILSVSAEKLEYFEKQGFELVSTAILPGYMVLFFKKVIFDFNIEEMLNDGVTPNEIEHGGFVVGGGREG